MTNFLSCRCMNFYTLKEHMTYLESWTSSNSEAFALYAKYWFENVTSFDLPHDRRQKSNRMTLNGQMTIIIVISVQNGPQNTHGMACFWLIFSELLSPDWPWPFQIWHLYSSGTFPRYTYNSTSGEFEPFAASLADSRAQKVGKCIILTFDLTLVTLIFIF